MILLPREIAAACGRRSLRGYCYEGRAFRPPLFSRKERFYGIQPYRTHQRRDPAGVVRPAAHGEGPRVADAMLTITHVDTTSDLRYSRIYISAMDRTHEKDLMRGLKSAGGYLRHELGQRLQLRYTPELQFFADDSIAHGAHILDMLHHIKPANPANADIVLPEDK